MEELGPLPSLATVDRLPTPCSSAIDAHVSPPHGSLSQRRQQARRRNVPNRCHPPTGRLGQVRYKRKLAEIRCPVRLRELCHQGADRAWLSSGVAVWDGEGRAKLLLSRQFPTGVAARREARPPPTVTPSAHPPEPCRGPGMVKARGQGVTAGEGEGLTKKKYAPNVRGQS